MLCPEGIQFQNEAKPKDEEDSRSKKNPKIPIEGIDSSAELNSFKNPKKWKKSITNFFRNQLRSTKSNDGDRPSGSNDKFEDKDISPEQRWQSLGKVFRRQSFADHWNKPTNHQGESSNQSKRTAVKRVLSSYFGKSQKTLSLQNEK